MSQVMYISNLVHLDVWQNKIIAFNKTLESLKYFVVNLVITLSQTA